MTAWLCRNCGTTMVELPGPAPRIPDDPEEGVARVLRGEGVLHCEELGLTYDYASMEATRDGQALALTPTERGLLVYLLREPRRVHSRAEISQALWGRYYAELESDSRAIDSQLHRLRGKLGGRRVIRSVPGLGWALL